MKWFLIVVAFLILFVGVIAIMGMLLPKAHIASRASRFKQSPQAIWDVIAGPPDWRSDIRGFENLPARNDHRSWAETDKHGQTIAYESVEEIPCAARVQVQAAAQRLAVLRSLGEFSEHAEFNGAEKSLRAPKAKAKLHDFVGSKLVRHKFHLRDFIEFEQGNSNHG